MKHLFIILLGLIFINKTQAQLYINGAVSIQNGVTLYADDSISLGTNAAITTNGILQSTKGINTNKNVINTGTTGFIITPIPSGVTKTYDIGTSNNNKLVVLHTSAATVNYLLAVRDSINFNPQTNESKITTNAVNKTWIVQPLSNSTNNTIGLFWNPTDELSGFNRSVSGMSKWQSEVTSAWAFVNGTSAATLTGSTPAYAKTVVVGNMNTETYYFGVGDINSNLKYDNVSRITSQTPIVCGASTFYNVNIIGTDTFSSPYQWQFINSNDSTITPTNDVTTQILGNKTQSVQFKLWRRISRVGTNNPDTSNWFLITMNTLPNALFSFIQSQGNVTFSPSQNGLTYKWYFGDGDSSAVQNPVHKYKTNGNYLVKLKVLNANSCEKDTTITVSVNTVGVNNIGKTASTIAIYPNPSSGVFTISSTQAISSIEVFDATGKMVFNQQNNTKQTNTEIDLSALSNGIYFILAQTENGGISNSKIIISK